MAINKLDKRMVTVVAAVIFGAAVIVIIYAVNVLRLQFRDVNFADCEYVSSRDLLTTRRPVPRRIHQLYFGETGPMSEKFQNARKTWMQLNPDWVYTLWNKSMVDELIDVNYPDIRPLYDSYTHWIRRVDVARMLIVYHYGGIVIDINIACTTRIDDLVAELPLTKDIGFYQAKPSGLSCELFFARPKSDFLRSALCGLREAKHNYILPYLNTILTTGPMFLGSIYAVYPKKDSIFVMQEDQVNMYLQRFTGRSWHQFDGLVVSYIYYFWHYCLGGYILGVLAFRTFKVFKAYFLK